LATFYDVGHCGQQQQPVAATGQLAEVRSRHRRRYQLSCPRIRCPSALPGGGRLAPSAACRRGTVLHEPDPAGHRFAKLAKKIKADKLS
jgi:hypothetical protein